jgi:hypothetical protein
MVVTLAEIPTIETELATFCSQAKLSVDGGGIPSTRQNLFFFFNFFLLGIFLVYIFNAIPKVPHTHPLNPLPTHSPFLALAFPCTGAYKVGKSNGPLCSDGQLGHLLMHMQLETRAPGYWLVHIVVPPIGLQFPLAPWVISLAPVLGAV